MSNNLIPLEEFMSDASPGLPTSGLVPLEEFGGNPTQEEPATYAMRVMQAHGWSKEQAAGIVGNLIHESNLNTGALGDGGESFGIAQWNGARRKGLEAFAAARGSQANDFNTQLDYINHELQDSESSAGQALKGTADVDSATRIFSERYERPGKPMMESRLAHANKIYDPEGYKHIEQGQFMDVAGGADLGFGMSPVGQEAQPGALYQGVREYLGLNKEPWKMSPVMMKIGREVVAATPEFPEPVKASDLSPEELQFAMARGLQVEDTPGAFQDWQDRQAAAGDESMRIMGRFVDGYTASLTEGAKQAAFGDTFMPQTPLGTALGQGAYLAGQITGPFKLIKMLTGNYLFPTVEGLRTTSQILTAGMKEGAVNLGLLQGLSRVVPAMIENDDFNKWAMSVLSDAKGGALVGAAFPMLSLVPGQGMAGTGLRMATGFAAMDYLRAAPGKWSTLGDFTRAFETWDEESKKQFASLSYQYLLDLYFANSVRPIREQMAAYNQNQILSAMSKLPPQDLEKEILAVRGQQPPAEFNIAEPGGPEAKGTTTVETPQVVKDINPDVAESFVIPQTAESQGFKPSAEWQELQEGLSYPPGGEFRTDAAGKNYGRWPALETASAAQEDQGPWTQPGKKKVSYDMDKALENYDRGTILKAYGGFNSKAEVLKNFAPEERRMLFPFLRKNAQGPDTLLDEVRTSYPHLFGEYESDHDLLRAIINGDFRKKIDYDTLTEERDRYYEAIDRQAATEGLDPEGLAQVEADVASEIARERAAIQSEGSSREVDLSWDFKPPAAKEQPELALTGGKPKPAALNTRLDELQAEYPDIDREKAATVLRALPNFENPQIAALSADPEMFSRVAQGNLSALEREQLYKKATDLGQQLGLPGMDEPQGGLFSPGPSKLPPGVKEFKEKFGSRQGKPDVGISAIENPGAEVEYSSGGDSIKGEYHGYIAAVDKKTGKVIGQVTYSYWNGETAVKMVEVVPEYQRQGIATKLLEKLQSESETPIKPFGDFATDSGAGVWDKFVAARETKMYSGGPDTATLLGQLRENVSGAKERWKGVKDNLRETLAPASLLQGERITVGQALITMMGRKQEAIKQAGYALMDFRRLFERTPPEEWGKLAAAWQRGEKTGSDLDRAYEIFHEINEALVPQISEFKDLPYQENYLRQAWKNSKDAAFRENIGRFQAGDAFKNYADLNEHGNPRIYRAKFNDKGGYDLEKMGEGAGGKAGESEAEAGQEGGGRTLTGGRSYFQKKEIPDWQTGMMLGGQPKFKNLFDLMMFDISEKNQFIWGNTFIKWAYDHEYLKEVLRSKMPFGWQEIHDPTQKISFTSLREIEDARPFAAMPGDYDMTAPGKYKIGIANYVMAAPEDAARIINNWLSPGLRGNAIYDLYRDVVDPVRRIGVAFSTFHLRFTMNNSLATGTGQALSKAIGDLIAGDMGGVAKAVKSGVLNLTGTQFLSQLKEGQNLAEVLYKGSDDPILKGALRRFIDTGGTLPPPESMRPIVKSMGEAMWEGLVNFGQFHPFKAAGKFIEAGTEPIMTHAVPFAKLGGFGVLDRALSERLDAKYAKLAAAQPDKAQDLATQRETEYTNGLFEINKHLDNIYGQMNYDSLLINKTVKDLLFFVIKYPGWNIGSGRWMAAMVGGLKHTLTPGQQASVGEQEALRMGLGLVVNMGIYSSLLYWFINGEAPPDISELYTKGIWTGGYTRGGNKEYVRDASYWRDLWGMTPINQQGEIDLAKPFQTVKAKLQDIWRIPIELFDNKEAYSGYQIATPGHPEQWLEQYGAYVGKQVVPYSFRGMYQAASPWGKYGSFAGFTPTPARLTDTPAMQELRSYREAEAPIMVTSQKQDKREVKRNLMDLAYEGDGRGFLQALRQARSEGQVSSSQYKSLVKDGVEILHDPHYGPLKNTFRKLGDLGEAIKVYGLATPEEREALRQLMVKKWGGAQPDTRRKYRQEFMELKARIEAGQ